MKGAKVVLFALSLVLGSGSVNREIRGVFFPVGKARRLYSLIPFMSCILFIKSVIFLR